MAMPAPGHVTKTAQPDKAVGLVEVTELADDVQAERLLRLDELTLEERDQLVAAARMQHVLTQLDNAVFMRPHV